MRFEMRDIEKNLEIAREHYRTMSAREETGIDAEIAFVMRTKQATLLAAVTSAFLWKHFDTDVRTYLEKIITEPHAYSTADKDVVMGVLSMIRFHRSM